MMLSGAARRRWALVLFFLAVPAALFSCGGTSEPSAAPQAHRAIVAADYNTLAPPPRGQSFRDPAFGTSILRLSDGPEQFGLPVHHEYSSMSPFNKDNSRLLLLTGGGAFFVVDLTGKVVVDPGRLRICGSCEPRWSRTDPNLLYFHDGNRIKSFDVAAKKERTVRAFSPYKAIDFCGGEGDLSEDGDHIAVCGDKRFVHVYQFSADAVGPPLDTRATPYDWFDMTPDNNVIGHVVSEKKQRLMLYDKSMKLIREVAPWVGHNDRGRDLNGDEIIVIVASNDPQPPPGCEGNGVEKIRLSDSEKTCLLPLYWYESTHVSLNNSGGHPWALVSNTHTRGAAHPPKELPRGWEGQWGAYHNELTLVKLDGSEVRRLAHHRSRRYDGYWHTPRAAISGDGAAIVFDTNFNQYPVENYTDAYLIQLPKQ